MGWQDFTQRSLSYLANDLLLSDLALILNPSQVYLPPMFNGYAALAVSLEVQVVGTITVTITDATGIVPTWSERQTATAALQTLQFVSPYSYTPASALNVTVTSSVNQVHNCPTFINGYGTQINGSNGPGLTRPDGRAYPTGGTLIAAATGVGTAATLIPAPPAGVRIMLASLSLSTSGGNGSITATIGGAANDLFVLFSSTNGNAPVPASGWLLDPATPLLIAANGGALQIGVATYDLVV